MLKYVQVRIRRHALAAAIALLLLSAVGILSIPVVSNAQTASSDQTLLEAIRGIVEGSVDGLTAEVRQLKDEIRVLRAELQAVRGSGSSEGGGGVPAGTGSDVPVAPISFPIPDAELKLGDTGRDVERLQEALIRLGADLPAGATGNFLFQTRNALVRFQEENGLPGTGVLDDATRKRIKELLSVVLGRPVFRTSTSSPNGEPVYEVVPVSFAEISLVAFSDGMLVDPGSEVPVTWRTNGAPEGAHIVLRLRNKVSGAERVVHEADERSGTYQWTLPTGMAGDNEFVAELYDGSGSGAKLLATSRRAIVSILGGGDSQQTTESSSNTSTSNTGADTSSDYAAFYTGAAFTTCMAAYPDTIGLIESWLDQGLLRYQFPWGDITGAAATKVAECEGDTFSNETYNYNNSSNSNWTYKMWNFVNGTGQGSYILNRTDSEYTTFINSVYNDCASKYFAGWKPGGGDEGNWQEFGIPICSAAETDTGSGNGTVQMTKCFYPNATIDGTPPGYTVWCEGDYYNCHKGDPSGESISLTGLQLGAPSSCETGWGSGGSNTSGPSGQCSGTTEASCTGVANCYWTGNYCYYDSTGPVSAAPGNAFLANVATAVSGFFQRIFGF